MARFYGSVSGCAQTIATRRGSVKSGISGHVRGWNVGARVEITADGDLDHVRVFKTSGSNGGASDELIAEFKE